VARKKKHPEHVNHERWLVSYADFITLLFAFFVVMFAVSQVDSKKLGRFVESVNVAFQVQGLFPNSSGVPVGSGIEGSAVIPPIATPKPSVLPYESPGRSTASIGEEMERKVAELGAGATVELRYDPRGLIVSLGEEGFFRPGSAVVRHESLDLLRKLVQPLRELEYPLAVEGHTDDSPIRAIEYPSNWELSIARATVLVRFLADEAGFDAERLSAAGFAQYRPLEDNSTIEGRARNRRVELVLESERAPSD
jgi:chemotaxis protein MotB